jgi:GT2 family glycosyltransferase
MNQFNPRIFICIPVYNRIFYTLKCIESIKRQAYPNFQVIVCDDGSNDGTSQVLAEKHPEVIVLKGTGNLWWTGGTNMCVEEALKIGQPGDYIYTLNNDTEILSDTLINLLELENRFPGSVIGSVNVFYEDPDKIEPSAFVRSNKVFFKKLPKRIHNLGAPILKNIEFIEVDAFAGKGVLFPIKVFKKVGIYNAELLPHYHADSEFTLRVRDAGFKLLYSYTSKVLSHQYLTGTGTMNRNFFEFIRSFKNIKSAIHYESVRNFSKLAYGKGYRPYLYLQLIKIVAGFFKRFIKSYYQ